MTTARITNPANPSGSTLSTSSLIDVLSDDSDMELIPASSESKISDYEDVSNATSLRTDSRQRNEGKMNSTSVLSLLSVLRAPRLSDLTRKEINVCTYSQILGNVTKYVLVHQLVQSQRV